MEINKNLEDGKLFVALKGRLDTITSQELLANLTEVDQAKELEFDFKELEYISSAGLRAILAYQKKLGGKDKVVIRNMNPVVENVFKVTGFETLVTIA